MTEYHTKTNYKDSTKCPYQEKAAKWDLYLEKGSAYESFLEEENKRLKELLATVEKDH